MENKKLLIVGLSRTVHTTQRIIREASDRELEYEFVKWGSLAFYGGRIFSESKEIDLSCYGAVFCDIPSYKLVLKKSKEAFNFRLYNELNELCKLAKRSNITLLNREFLLENPFYNKFAQAQLFAQKNINTIPTFHPSDNKLSKISSQLEKLGWKYPVVIKRSEGGMGQAVWKAEDQEQLSEIISEKRNQSLVYQPFIKNDCDYRVLVIGGKALGIMKRVAKTGEWKNNFALGGSVMPFEDEGMKRFCEEVCQKMNLDYVGLDVFKLENGYMIIEANVFACFEGFEEAFPQTNVAGHILNCLMA